MANKNKIELGYVGAPYNFIEMNEKVYEKAEPVGHDTIDQDKHSGKILYEIEAKTPIMVDDGTRHFYRNAYGKVAIPGSSVRGLVRGNLQILSFSSIADDVQDGALMYRNVANGVDKDSYDTVLGNTLVQVGNKRMSVLKNVRAGYIKKDGDKYFIVPTVVDTIDCNLGDMNYYVLSEYKIIKAQFDQFEYLDQKPCILQNKDIGAPNSKYRPYYREISYQVITGTRVISGIAGKGELPKNGFLLSSGKMQGKKAIYVIPEIKDDRDRYIEIPQSDIDDFKRDYEGRKNQVEAMDKQFFNLPAEGEIKPVFYIIFYIEDKKKLYFGFTPHLRMFYDKKICDGLKDSHKNAKVDYCKSIFGYTDHGQGGYKSRVSFLDAVLQSGTEGKGEKTVILASPKPTSYLDYLTAEKDDDDRVVASYNDDFKLRGTKQYWLRETVYNGETGTNEKVGSLLRPYEAGSVYQGEIRFENLTDVELGMLLWSLVLEKGSNQNIGKAKPYGYGRIAVKLTGLKILDFGAMYSAESLSLDPYADQLEKAEEYIRAGKEDMTKFLGHNVMEDPRIKQFFMMKDASNMPKNDKTRYMSLQKKEYQSRVSNLAKLPTVEDVVAGRPAKIGKTDRGGQGGNPRGGQGGSRDRLSGSRSGQGNGKKPSSGKERAESVYKDSGSFSNNAVADAMNRMNKNQKKK